MKLATRLTAAAALAMAAAPAMADLELGFGNLDFIVNVDGTIDFELDVLVTDVTAGQAPVTGYTVGVVVQPALSGIGFTGLTNTAPAALFPNVPFASTTILPDFSGVSGTLDVPAIDAVVPEVGDVLGTVAFSFGDITPLSQVFSLLIAPETSIRTATGTAAFTSVDFVVPEPAAGLGVMAAAAGLMARRRFA